MPTDPEVSISRVLPGESATLYRLLQLYYYESSRCSREDVQNNGLYESDEAGVAQYTNNASGDEAYFVRANGNLAGFALVDRYQGDDGPVQELADLFILPKYRGQGLATGLIEHTVLGNEQKWLLAVFRADADALSFWKRTFAQLPFKSVRAIDDDPEFYLYVVNE